MEPVILITGGSTGIGAALAKVLAQQISGVKLAIAARSAEKLNAIADQCSKLGAEVLVVPTDLTQLDQVQSIAQQVLDRFERIDVLINNASYGQMGPVELIPAELVERQFKVNVLGAIALIQAVIPAMRRQGGGKIINISSIAGKIAFPFGGLYSASKFALEALSDTLRRELEPFNIRVSIVEPGPVTTDFFEVVSREVDRAVPNALNTPYRAAFENLEQLEKLTKSQAWTAERVALVILKAVLATRPRSRYVAASSGDLLIFMMAKLLLTRWVDRFWQKFYGIDLVAKDWKSRQHIS
jgi:short-subunit dehydrogenase